MKTKPKVATNQKGVAALDAILASIMLGILVFSIALFSSSILNTSHSGYRTVVETTAIKSYLHENYGKWENGQEELLPNLKVNFQITLENLDVEHTNIKIEKVTVTVIEGEIEGAIYTIERSIQ